MRTDVTFRGSKADQFERIQNYLEDRCGHELSRADVVSILMGEFEQALENNRGCSVNHLSER